MKYYYHTASKGKCGCAYLSWKVGEYKSKAELKRDVAPKWSSRKVEWCMTEEELRRHYGENADALMARCEKNI